MWPLASVQLELIRIIQRVQGILTFNTLVILQETVLLTPQLLHHPSLYRMLDGREDGGPEEEVDEVDNDQKEDPPWWSHHCQYTCGVMR